MKTSDFFYNLPRDLIAQVPLKNRSDSRMLVYNKNSQSIAHAKFLDFANYLSRGDVLVINDTKVIPARIFGVKADTGGKIEFLLLKRLEIDTWIVALKPGKRAQVGSVFNFAEKMTCEIIGFEDGGLRRVKFNYSGVFESILNELGEMPLPHYIKQKLSKDNEARYNTVYASKDGSAAAPTAGLHFTEKVLKEIEGKGVEIVRVLLHVGLGTFRPVKCENILEHKMHSEYYELSEDAASKINTAKAQGKKIFAIGTTSVRVLESCEQINGKIKSSTGNTEIFIYPGYTFKFVDAVLTNFHLPESTLIMLVSAFMGKEKTLSVYEEAVEEKYRFFSFGDCMLIV